jgi:phospholipid/cholesterol/gamma-HCH transport system substrate-binding protein
MSYKSNEIKVGVMLLVTLVLFVVFLVAVFGIDFGKETKEYYTYLEYVGGIKPGSLVKYNGMDVGKVEEVTLPENMENDNRILLKLSVSANTPVRRNSQAFLTSIGIMTDKHIEISPGSPDVPMLESGSFLESKEVLGFTQMAEPLGALSETAEELMTRLADIFNDENREHIATMLAEMDRVVSRGSGNIINMMNNLDSLTASLAGISTDLEGMLNDNRNNLDSTMTHIEETSRQTNELIGDLRMTLTQMRVMMSDNGANFAEIMENFQFASQNLEEFSRLIKERPWLLVRKSAPPEREIP